MLASKCEAPFTHPEWLFEIKLDGYRILAVKQGKKGRLLSRSGLDYSRKYPAIREIIETFDEDVVLDGEMVVLDKQGKPDFDALQNYRLQKQIALVYYVFDLLYYKRKSLLNEPLIKRKQLLKDILPQHSQVRYTEHQLEKGEELFKMVESRGMEGIVAKKINSNYQPGVRSNNWYKIATEKVEDFVVGGYQLRDDQDKLKSLIFGAFKDGALIYIGHTGAGMKEKERKTMLSKLEPLEINRCPFQKINYPENSRTRWIKPELVISAKFHTYTAGRHIRKPAIFKGFRDDKPASQVLYDDLFPPGSGEEDSREKEVSGNWGYVEKDMKIDPETIEVEGKSLQLWNLKKVLWPDEKITKGQLLLYYSDMADYILPYLRDRPESLQIKYQQVHRPGVYIKDVEGKAPDWVNTWSIERKIRKPGKRDNIEYLLCQDLPTLLYMINLGCIDCHPWFSTFKAPDHPTFVAIDIDPTDSPFSEVVEVALLVKDILDRLKIPGYPKTSGKTGLHIYIPLANKYPFEQAEQLAQAIATLAYNENPDLITRERLVKKRGEKVYIDWLQNKKQQTLAAPYSVRPFAGATVSAPLQWEEVNGNLNPADFNIFNMKERVKEAGDIFQGALKAEIPDLEALKGV